MENTEKEIEKKFKEMKEYTLRRIEEFGAEAVLAEEELLKYATITEEFYDLVYELMYVNGAIDDPNVEAALIAMNPYLDMICTDSGKINDKLHDIEDAWWKSNTPPKKTLKYEFMGIDLENPFENYNPNIIE